MLEKKNRRKWHNWSWMWAFDSNDENNSNYLPHNHVECGTNKFEFGRSACLWERHTLGKKVSLFDSFHHSSIRMAAVQLFRFQLYCCHFALRRNGGENYVCIKFSFFRRRFAFESLSRTNWSSNVHLIMRHNHNDRWFFSLSKLKSFCAEEHGKKKQQQQASRVFMLVSSLHSRFKVFDQNMLKSHKNEWMVTSLTSTLNARM